jgi:type I restriction enzyme M protein
VLENDWVEALIALPLNIFYNTGIATYIWVLSQPQGRARASGKVQLIDASQWFQPLRKQSRQEELRAGSEGDIQRIVDLYLGEAQETAQSKWFDTQDFGYWKITVERPLRLKSQLKPAAIETLRFASGDEALRAEIYATHGDKLYTDFAKLKPEIEAWLKGDDSGDGDDAADSNDEDGEDAHPRRRLCRKSAARSCSTLKTWERDKAAWSIVATAAGAAGLGRRASSKTTTSSATRFDAALNESAGHRSSPAAEQEG